MKSSLPAFFLLFSSLGLWAKPSDVDPSNIEARVYESKDGRSLPYRIFKPTGYDPAKKYPLVLCLHGAGGRGTDNQSRGVQAFVTLASAKVQQEYPCFLLTPQCPENKQWVNSPWSKGSYSLDATPVSEEMRSVIEILETVQKEFSIDPARIYVTGQSMGGYGTWNILMLRPDLFAAAIPVCGGGDPAKAKSIASIPIWTFHGSDDNAVPVQGSRDMDKALRDAGSKVSKYTEYPGVKHPSWTNAWKEAEIVPWLFSQHKKD